MTTDEYMSLYLYGLYTLLYVWCDFKAQTLIINTDPFSSFLSEGKLI